MVDTAAGGLVGIGAFVLVDSEIALHAYPHLSGRLAQTPWWL